MIQINEGHIYVLPSRIPHSPQRQENTLGLVIERKRSEHEMDALIWYVDFEDCREKLFERYFACSDLGRDLVPVVNEYKASSEFATRARTDTSLSPDPPCKQDLTTVVPDPVNLAAFVESHAAALEQGQVPAAAPGPALCHPHSCCWLRRRSSRKHAGRGAAVM